MLDDPPLAPLTAEQEALFDELFSSNKPMIDLRSPSEFAKGAFPSSTNIPLMNDIERAKVGTEYKRNGQDAAIILGHQLVSGDSKQALIKRWTEHYQAHPDAYLYCFRGGLRSKTVQGWMAEQGIEIPLVEGGYKALRRYLITQLEQIVTRSKFYVVGGRTGTAKTGFIQGWQNHIDLEGLANHRGSSFGRRATEQPTVIDFENLIAIDLLKKRDRMTTYIVEDEGVVIGRCSIPLALRETMKQSPILILEKPFSERVETILNDYVIGLSEEYAMQYPEDGEQRYMTAMIEALGRIKKRLGGQRYKAIHELLLNALTSMDLDQHRAWIIRLLNDYYDPMYDYQISNKESRIVCQGDENTLTEYLCAKGLEVTGNQV